MEEIMALDNYIEEKIRMLMEDFGLESKIEDRELRALRRSTSTSHCDRLARSIINKYM